MGWFDDAKDKAEETAEEARRKAAEEAGKAAGKAAVAAATTAAKKSVGAFFEGIVSSAEASLEAAQEERGHTGERNQVLDELEASLDAEDVEDADDETEVADAPPRTGPSLEDRLAAMRAERGSPLADPVPPPAPEPALLPPAPAPAALDPMAKAMAALETARRARGVDIDAVPAPPPQPVRSTDPLAAVDEALAKAAAAREHARSGGRAAMAREQAAREQLAALKSVSASLDTGPAAPAAAPSDDLPDGPTGGPTPKKRSL